MHHFLIIINEELYSFDKYFDYLMYGKNLEIEEDDVKKKKKKNREKLVLNYFYHINKRLYI